MDWNEYFVTNGRDFDNYLSLDRNVTADQSDPKQYFHENFNSDDKNSSGQFYDKEFIFDR